MTMRWGHLEVSTWERPIPTMTGMPNMNCRRAKGYITCAGQRGPSARLAWAEATGGRWCTWSGGAWRTPWSCWSTTTPRKWHSWRWITGCPILPQRCRSRQTLRGPLVGLGGLIQRVWTRHLPKLVKLRRRIRWRKERRMKEAGLRFIQRA